MQERQRCHSDCASAQHFRLRLNANLVFFLSVFNRTFQLLLQPLDCFLVTGFELLELGQKLLLNSYLTEFEIMKLALQTWGLVGLHEVISLCKAYKMESFAFLRQAKMGREFGKSPWT